MLSLAGRASVYPRSASMLRSSRISFAKSSWVSHFSSIPSPPPPPTGEVKQTLWAKSMYWFRWLQKTAKEKGKPFIAWYVTLYFGGLLGSYAIVRAYGKVEPEVVKEYAYKFKLDKLVDLEKIELSKRNCEYLAALLMNEAVDTPRLILAVLTVDRVILLGRKIAKRGKGG